MNDPLRGCYLCAPDNPNADEEACTDCDREFWNNPVLIYVDDQEDDLRD